MYSIHAKGVKKLTNFSKYQQLTIVPDKLETLLSHLKQFRCENINEKGMAIRRRETSSNFLRVKTNFLSSEINSSIVSIVFRINSRGCVIYL